MKIALAFVCLSIVWTTTVAQMPDSLQINAGTTLTVASKNFLPLWLQANKFGVISDQGFDLSTHLRITNSHRFGEAYNPIYNSEDKGFFVSYGFDVYNNAHFNEVLLQEAYFKVRHKKLTLSGGRFKQIIGEIDHDLSSGSLGVSGNALPIPKVNLSLEYTDIPFTNGFAQFKGLISYGWMGNEQYMKGSLLHEKTLYVRLGKNKLKFYGGIQHYAVWGGNRDGVRLDRSLGGFLNVLLVKAANDGSVPDGVLPNRAGDHRGVIEMGLDWENDAYKINLNSQMPFDMGQGITPKNVDRLLSVNFTNKTEDALFKKITVEFIYTKQMNNFYKLVFRESYYNNGVYKTGWEYNDHIIGTPLFINRTRGQYYFDNIKPYNWDASASLIPGNTNIINNRVVGGHVGFITRLNDALLSKTLLTYTRNYGDYNAGNFNQTKSQGYTLEQIYWAVPNSSLSINAGIAYDFGSLSHNIGSSLGIEWNLKK